MAMSSKTEKMILQRFNKEFTQILCQVLSRDKVPLNISFDSFKLLMIELGCVSPQGGNRGAVKEHRMLQELWAYMQSCNGVKLERSEDDIALVGNIKVILMAIFQVKGNKRMGVDAADRNDETDVPLAYGWINGSNQLHLTTNDVQKLSIKYAPLNLNRIATLSKKRSTAQRQQVQQYSFRPNINASSRSLARQRRLASNQSQGSTSSSKLQPVSLSKTYTK